MPIELSRTRTATIYRNRRNEKRGETKKKRSGDGGRHKKAKVNTFICPICNTITSYEDAFLCYFLVQSKKIPINGKGFLSYCDGEGWPDPKIEFKKTFEIKLWLFERARDDIANIPKKKKKERKRALSSVKFLAKSIDLEIDFTQIIS
ncbi:MAG: hypothetical protein CO140_02605 [Candidatus Moranbacteria bacterium CG_4_9_14_3_um_filter_40_7]|nr:MAG: hypothetical protein CO140_02605 [Candidatus Moranbacteria bacterium CG_4_9_14_3_um_filter_40_7]